MLRSLVMVAAVLGAARFKSALGVKLRLVHIAKTHVPDTLEASTTTTEGTKTISLPEKENVVITATQNEMTITDTFPNLLPTEANVLPVITELAPSTNDISDNTSPMFKLKSTPQQTEPQIPSLEITTASSIATDIATETTDFELMITATSAVSSSRDSQTRLPDPNLDEDLPLPSSAESMKSYMIFALFLAYI